MGNKKSPFLEQGSPEQLKLNEFLQKLSNRDAEDSMRERLMQSTDMEKAMITDPSKRIDELIGVPARTAIGEMQKGNFDTEMLKKALSKIGSDASTAPTPVDLAEATGLDSPMAKAALATSIDLGSQLPGMKMPAGVSGRITTQVADKFPGVKKMFQAGGISFPAETTADALKIKRALEDAGKIGKNRALVEK